MRKIREVIRFELDYQLRRGSTLLYFAIFVGFVLVVTRIFVLDAREDGYFFNAPIITGVVTVIASMLALLVTAGVAGDAATRDVEVRLDPLVYTTPLRKAVYLGGRFLGAFAVTALLLVAVPLGLLVATRLPGIEPQLIGPFRAGAYLSAYFALALPNAFVSTAVIFSIAVLTRRALTAWAGAAVLFFAAFLTEGLLAAHLGRSGLGRLLDPLGFTALRGLWKTWNPAQRNELSVALDGALLANRLLWLGVALGILTLAWIRFRFAYHAGGGRRGAAMVDDVPIARWSRVAVPAARRAFGVSTRMRQLLAIAMRSLRQLVASRGWWIVPIAAVIFVVTAPELLEVELGTPGVATTARVAALYGANELAILITLLIALSAGELVWRERDARIHALADVTPVPEWLSVAGRFLAIALMLAAVHAIFLVAGLIVQVMQGVHQFDLGLYVQVLFGFQLTGHLLFAALAMVVHVLVNQKHAGNVVVVLAFFATIIAREQGFEHNLILYGGAPEWSYSEMGGFGPQVGPWLWFTSYWAGWALLFAAGTYLFWIRGEERGLRSRIALARRRLTRWPAVIGAAGVTIIAAAGGFVFYNTNVLNRYFTIAEVQERRAVYERRYSRYAAVPQPVLAGTKLRVDFYPRRGEAAIRGTYRLENRSDVAIEAIHLTTHSGVETNGVSFDRPSRLAVRDDDLGYRIYALGRPVQPGESLHMDFRVVHAPRGFTNEGYDLTVIPNGSWIEHRGTQTQRRRQWLPVIGYEAGRELDSAGTRAHHGLPARPATPLLHDMTARRVARGREKIAFEAIVGTDAGQIGVATGTLRRTWTENGRHYAHWAADIPITNGYAIYSARYAVHRASWRNVAIEIFHHPAHTGNLERMVRSVRASLEYHTRHFGPYPHRQLRLVEFPSGNWGMSLTAHEGAIKYSEAYARARPEDDARRIDLPFAVMAHEVGHQWWGHQIVPAQVEGAALLSESLAWYSGMLVVEKNLGRDHLTRLLDVMRSQYLAPHQTREVPLLRAVDSIDAYRTGPFAMFALREAVGEERVNAALRSLLAKFDPSRPPYPTSLDLYAELRAVTPAQLHPLLKDLFENITFWDLRMKKMDVQRSARGTHRVTLQIDAQKLEADAAGKEKPVPMNDLIEVGVFDANGQALYRRRHAIRSGGQTLTVTVSGIPARATIDPDHELLDRKPEDNVAEPARPAALVGQASGTPVSRQLELSRAGV